MFSPTVGVFSKTIMQGVIGLTLSKSGSVSRRHIDWLGQSLDLNPIQNICDALGKTLYSSLTLPFF